MDLERFTEFYNEIVALKESCETSHAALVTEMLDFVKEHKDRLLEFTPLELKVDTPGQSG
jgi:hypothetical protein